MIICNIYNIIINIIILYNRYVFLLRAYLRGGGSSTPPPLQKKRFILKNKGTTEVETEKK